MGSHSTQSEGTKEDFSNLGFTPMIKVDEPWTVEKVVKEIPGDAPVEGSSSPLAFFHMLGRLKTTKREGWRRFGINRGESIADHMYRMSLISMFAPPSLAPRLDLAKCIKMSLVHDMAELLVGDITPVDGVPKPEKSRRETATMDWLTNNLLRGVPGGAATGAELRAVWQEYEDAQTLDSHFVHDVDKMELLLQMLEYERGGARRLDLGEFSWVRGKITLPETRAWADELIAEREAFWGDKEHIRGYEGTEGGVKEEHTKQQEQYYQRD
ncbi:HD domain-containing protein [Beauveria bassiana ARSEF 2860]|uniref:5'-deoxynucleotidase n=1 Tax=Beauveria bassiana (strain ARSEF 2860) TaxID=655819 RepID=J4KQF9_BEAB2|nr:HD domain-containing protein [Beauveria bassiana ARSEF 2860]EJP69134.1 HD domain-containing protein [Beauveria bassiana ARSEF 2860]